MHHLHDNGTLLTPDALGGVLGLHVGGHAILHGARDVLLDHVGAVVPAGTQEGGTRRFAHVHRGRSVEVRSTFVLIKQVAAASEASGTSSTPLLLATGESVLQISGGPPRFHVPQMYKFPKRRVSFALPETI